MFYTILKQWKTLDGQYHSSTVDKANYDMAIGEYHSMFKPMQNDSNVASFRFMLIDENGAELEHCGWTRQVEQAEAEASEPVMTESGTVVVGEVELTAEQVAKIVELTQVTE